MAHSRHETSLPTTTLSKNVVSSITRACALLQLLQLQYIAIAVLLVLYGQPNILRFVLSALVLSAFFTVWFELQTWKCLPSMRLFCDLLRSEKLHVECLCLRQGFPGLSLREGGEYECSAGGFPKDPLLV